MENRFAVSKYSRRQQRESTVFRAVYTEFAFETSAAVYDKLLAVVHNITLSTIILHNMLKREICDKFRGICADDRSLLQAVFADLDYLSDYHVGRVGFAHFRGVSLHKLQPRFIVIQP